MTDGVLQLLHHHQFAFPAEPILAVERRRLILWSDEFNGGGGRRQVLGIDGFFDGGYFFRCDFVHGGSFAL